MGALILTRCRIMQPIKIRLKIAKNQIQPQHTGQSCNVCDPCCDDFDPCNGNSNQRSENQARLRQTQDHVSSRSSSPQELPKYPENKRNSQESRDQDEKNQFYRSPSQPFVFDHNDYNTPLFTYSPKPDFVLVWRDNSDEQTEDEAYEKREIFEYNLEEEGLILTTDTFKKLHVVKIWAPPAVLVTYAELLQIKLPIKRMGERLSKNIQPTTSRAFNNVSGKDDDDWTCLSRLTQLDRRFFPRSKKRFTEVFSRYKEYLFDLNESNVFEEFDPMVRSRVVQHILRKTAFKTGDELEEDIYAYGYEQLIQREVYEAGYALHDGPLSEEGSTRKLLYDHWGKMSNLCRCQPFDKIRDYFGEDFALYFAFLGFYTKMLMFAAIFGVLSTIYGSISIMFDEYVKNICTSSIIMCPQCDNRCPYWEIEEECEDSKLAHFFDNDITSVFAFLMSIWSAIFLVFWKRQVASIVHKWDLSNLDTKSDVTPRSEYVKALKRHYHERLNELKRKASKISHSVGRKLKMAALMELTLPFWSKVLPCSLFSYISCVLLIAIACVAFASVILYRTWLSWYLSMEYASTRQSHCFAWQKLTVSFSGALINLMFILIFGQIYKKLAYTLSEFEYHRTQTEFEASIYIKSFIFEALHNYGPICYIMFFKGAFVGSPNKYHRIFGRIRQEQCGISCIPDLCIQLAIVTCGREVGKCLKKIVIPWVKRVLKRRKQATKLRETFASVKESTEQWVQDFDLLECSTTFINEEFLDLALQFGFIAMFGAAFPLSPLIVFIANIFTIRVHALKLLKHHRRPVGLRVKDIGVWYNYVEGMVHFSLLTNAVIIGVSSNFIPKMLYRLNSLETGIVHPFGSLKGYLNYTLTAFSTADLEFPPGNAAIKRNNLTAKVCYHPTHRYDYMTSKEHRYHFKMEHFQIWFARAVFVIIYENVVALIVQIIKWMVPSIPSKIRVKARRDELLKSELIEMTELEMARKQKLLTAKHSRHKRKPKTKDMTTQDNLLKDGRSPKYDKNRNRKLSY